MKNITGFFFAAVLIAGLHTAAFADEARAPAANVAQPVAEHHDHTDVGALQCQAIGIALAQMQSDMAAMRADIAALRQQVTDMQAQQKPTPHSVADVPGR